MTRPPLSLRVTFLALDWRTQLALVASALVCAACGVATLIAVGSR